MKYRTIAILGVLSYVLEVVSSASDLSGNYISPLILIIISGIATLAFTFLAVVILWKSERFISITLATSTILLAILTAIQEITLPNYGSPIIILSNIVKVIDFIVFIYVICLLWAKSKHQEQLK